MLRICNAYANEGEIVIDDHITFKKGKFNTDFGEIQSSNYRCRDVSYELQSLNSFKEYLKNVKIVDGYINNFILFNPLNDKMLNEKFKKIQKNEKGYNDFGLNEEAILLFTKSIYLEYGKSTLVEYLCGRSMDSGLYLLKPNAYMKMKTNLLDSDYEEYEVLQSKRLGKRLVLNKINRKI